jgi:hypothetical protein
MKIVINTAKLRLKSPPKGVLIGFVALLIIAVFAFGVYAFMQWKDTQELLKNPEKREQEEFKAAVKTINRHIKLPGDETPTLATVSEADRLKNMVFFKNARNGDKVLMYIKNKKAYLYRPSEDVIIEVAAINISDTQLSSPAPIASTSPKPSGQSSSEPGLDKPATVTIRNGTTIANYSATTKERLSTEKYLNITAIENAARQDYTQTVVVVLNEAFEEHGKELAKKYNVTPVVLPPEGETVPKTDILLILGQ